MFSYKTFMDEALALQLARELVEKLEVQQDEGMSAALEELTDRSRDERERFERLARKSP